MATSLLSAVSPSAIRQPLILFCLEVPPLLLRPPPLSRLGLRSPIPSALNLLKRLNPKNQSLSLSCNPPPPRQILASPLGKPKLRTALVPPLQVPSTLVLVTAGVVVVVVALLHPPLRVLTLEQPLRVTHSDNQLVDLPQAVPQVSRLLSLTLVLLPQVPRSLSAVNQHLLLLVVLIYPKQQHPLRLEARTLDSAHLHPARPSVLLLK